MKGTPTKPYMRINKELLCQQSTRLAKIYAEEKDPFENSTVDRSICVETLYFGNIVYDAACIDWDMNARQICGYDNVIPALQTWYRFIHNPENELEMVDSSAKGRRQALVVAHFLGASRAYIDALYRFKSTVPEDLDELRERITANFKNKA